MDEAELRAGERQQYFDIVDIVAREVADPNAPTMVLIIIIKIL
jgi:hypothetical protein